MFNRFVMIAFSLFFLGCTREPTTPREEAEQAQEDLEAAREKAADIIAESEAEAVDMIADAQDDAKQEVRDAKREADAMIRDAESELSRKLDKLGQREAIVKPAPTTETEPITPTDAVPSPQ
ncbi:hypothetical protein Pla52o_14270 [Novipirellula galeiformis]|uniref:Secreted protein n=1 Tax=Novipirellula galeiformis TaxID=2528004 RepID=A0A5C6CQN0_9BACT|nr:hypothetical protein [Novipirellula galeiformis]TWU25129.1 hypothetical protein Pla52o_14270 [Novipirellula galeiformis]